MNLKDIDLELLDELIEKCEAKMAAPFRKAKPDKAVVVVEHEEGKEDPAEAAEGHDEPSEEGNSEDDTSEEDLEQLMELYKKLKA